MLAKYQGRFRMAESVQDVWDRFERWEDRYLKACAKQIKRTCKKGYSDDLEMLRLLSKLQ